MTKAFIHKQLDRLTYDIHRRTIQGVDEESKRLILQCASFFDIISSSLFIAVAYFWDPVSKQRECEGKFPFIT